MCQEIEIETKYMFISATYESQENALSPPTNNTVNLEGTVLNKPIQSQKENSYLTIYTRDVKSSN